jgi:DNA-binding winged helix-turn-helix (wHTH) protein
MSAPVVARKCCRFGPFELDIDNGELRKGGARLQLQDQPRKILGILLESAGRVVTRDELRAAIWPADTYVGFDHSLNTAIRTQAEYGDPKTSSG